MGDRKFHLVLVLLYIFIGAGCSKKKEEDKPDEVAVILPEKIQVSFSGTLEKETKSKSGTSKSTSSTIPTIDVKLKRLVANNNDNKLSEQKKMLKRDPFFSSINWFADEEIEQSKAEALRDFNVNNYKYVGFIYSAGMPQALIEDPAGIGYTLSIGEILGRDGGRVHTIDKDKLVVKTNELDSAGQKLVNYVTLELGK